MPMPGIRCVAKSNEEEPTPTPPSEILAGKSLPQPIPTHKNYSK